MKHVNVGDNIRISRSDVIDIKRIASDDVSRRIQPGDLSPDSQWTKFLVINKSETAISQYSVIGIEAPKMDDFEYDNYKYDPRYFPEEKNNPIEFDIRTHGYQGLLLKCVLPEYREHQSVFGILEQDLQVDEIGWCVVSGYCLARVYIDSVEYERDRWHARLRPPEIEDIKTGGTIADIPLNFNPDDENKYSYGSPILVQPGTWEMLEDADGELYQVVPEGEQIARVWLGSSFDLVWVEIWKGL